MRRRTILGVVAAMVTVGGCLGDDLADGPGGDGREDGSDDDPVVDHFDDSPERPECTRESETIEIEGSDGETDEFETAETTPYPDPPSSFTSDELLDYAAEYEQAYITQNVLCDRDGDDHVLTVVDSIEARDVFDWYDEVTIVYLERLAGASHGVYEDGSEWQSDIAPTVACYAIDESGVARVRAEYLSPDEYESEGPDPLEEGSLVYWFE